MQPFRGQIATTTKRLPAKHAPVCAATMRQPGRDGQQAAGRWASGRLREGSSRSDGAGRPTCPGFLAGTTLPTGVGAKVVPVPLACGPAGRESGARGPTAQAGRRPAGGSRAGRATACRPPAGQRGLCRVRGQWVCRVRGPGVCRFRGPGTARRRLPRRNATVPVIGARRRTNGRPRRLCQALRPSDVGGPALGFGTTGSAG